MTGEEISPRTAASLPLKNSGGLINVELALVRMHYLQAMLDAHPHDFETLLALALGQNEGVSPESVKRLRHEGLVAKDSFAVAPEMQNILLAGYQKTPDGHLMGYPFALDDPRTRQIIQDADQRTRDRWAAMVFGDKNKGRAL